MRAMDATLPGRAPSLDLGIEGDREDAEVRN